MPPLDPAIDPAGQSFELTQEGKLALGLFALAAIWWVLEVVPIGVTGIAIAVIQALFLIREPRVALTDYLDPAVWFIIGSIVIGQAFSKTGLTHRMAYRMLMVVGNRTSHIYLGAFVMTAALTLIMAHTAVAAAVYPLLMAIHHLYTDEDYSRFGRGCSSAWHSPPVPEASSPSSAQPADRSPSVSSTSWSAGKSDFSSSRGTCCRWAR